MHLRISVPNNHQYKWRKNDHLSYTALSSAKTGLKLHYSSKHPVSAHCKVNHPFVCRNDHPLQLFITNSNMANIKLQTFHNQRVYLHVFLAVHFLFEFPFSQYLSSKFNYKAYNPLI